MIKKIFWMLVLLTITACTVLFGEGFEIPFLDPTPTAIVFETATAIPTDATLEPTGMVEASPTAIETSQVDLTTEPTIISTVPSTPTVLPPTATFTPTTIPPTVTLTPTIIATNTPFAVLYAVQPATPVFMVNFVHESEACAWQGVAGQVFDITGKPVMNYIIRITGVYDGKPFNQIGITGMVAGNPYGIGGYEIALGATALDSIDQLSIQVFDALGTPITDPLPFSTSSNCSKNLVIINFIEK
jgi:hypothetical protein